MGLLDYFFPSEESKLAGHIRTLIDRDAQPEDREFASSWLADNGSPQALLGLLSRFDMQLDNQMKDAAEKDVVESLAMGVGAPMKRPLEAWLKRCRVFGRPLSMYRELFGKEAAVDVALSVLQVEYDKDDLNKPQKKRELLIWLAECPERPLIEEASRFLDDFDEGVRYAAAEVIIAQEKPEGKAPLLARLAHPQEDSNRLRTRLAEVFISRRWNLDELADTVAKNPPHGYIVSNGLLAKA